MDKHKKNGTHHRKTSKKKHAKHQQSKQQQQQQEQQQQYHSTDKLQPSDKTIINVTPLDTCPEDAAEANTSRTRSLHSCKQPWRRGEKQAPVQLCTSRSEPYLRSILALLNRITDTKMEVLVRRATALLLPPSSASPAGGAHAGRGSRDTAPRVQHRDVGQIRKDFIRMLLEKAQDEEMYTRDYCVFLRGLCTALEVETERIQLEREEKLRQTTHLPRSESAGQGRPQWGGRSSSGSCSSGGEHTGVSYSEARACDSEPRQGCYVDEYECAGRAAAVVSEVVEVSDGPALPELLHDECLRRFNVLYDALRGMHAGTAPWSDYADWTMRRQLRCHLRLLSLLHHSALLPLAALRGIRDALAAPLEGGALHDGAGIIQEGGGVIQEGGGVIQEGGGVIQEGGGAIQEGGGVIQEGGGVIQEGGGVIQEGGGVIQEEGGVIQEGGGVILEEGAEVMGVAMHGVGRVVIQEKSGASHCEGGPLRSGDGAPQRIAAVDLVVAAREGEGDVTSDFDWEGDCGMEDECDLYSLADDDDERGCADDSRSYCVDVVDSNLNSDGLDNVTVENNSNNIINNIFNNANINDNNVNNNENNVNNNNINNNLNNNHNVIDNINVSPESVGNLCAELLAVYLSTAGHLNLHDPGRSGELLLLLQGRLLLLTSRQAYLVEDVARMWARGWRGCQPPRREG